jgi:hypothetical protein
MRDWDYYDDDDYYGSHDTVSYCRWLYNRTSAKHVAKELGISNELAGYIGNSLIPGRICLSEIPDMETAKRLYADVKKNREAQERKSEFQQSFHEGNSRRMKIRLNKLSDIPEAYVLRQLMEAEEFNIKAKDCIYKYKDYNYLKKSECLRNAIARLPKTGWRYWWQRGTGVTAYIFFVELPEGQVSWHGMEEGDMAGVSFEKRDLWDGARAVTLPRIVLSVNRLCPSLLADKFNRESCAEELRRNVAI